MARKIISAAFYVIYTVLLTACANCFCYVRDNLYSLFYIVPIFILINLIAGFFALKTRNVRLRFCHHGAILLCVFFLSALASVAFHIVLAFKTIPDDYMTFIWSAVVCILSLALVFWNGILCVYLTSLQLGIKLRVIGIICGLIPVANLVALFFIVKTALCECYFEAKKEETNCKRHSDAVCKTKYPILLVHGVFFRDTKFFNYWGRIPRELKANGAEIYYGNHPSAASIENSAKELAARIEEILKESGAEKVNIIAHSKGGLDCRYAISKLGMAPNVASLTTINTPHRGCAFADYLLGGAPDSLKNKLANTYNGALKKLGEEQSDFLAAVYDLTASYLTELDAAMPAPEGVYCQSVGSVLQKASGGKFPLNFSYHLVKFFDEKNDGLVGEESFKWGEKYTLLTPTHRRGISHGDMIDLNRQNIRGFDVREFYVNLVSDLKNRGL